MSKALDYLVISQEELDRRYREWIGNLILDESRCSYDQWKDRFYITFWAYDNYENDYVRDDNGNVKVITTLKEDYKSFKKRGIYGVLQTYEVSEKWKAANDLAKSVCQMPD